MVMNTGVGADCGDACCHPHSVGESRTGALLSAFPRSHFPICNSDKMRMKRVIAGCYVLKLKVSSFVEKEVMSCITYGCDVIFIHPIELYHKSVKYGCMCIDHGVRTG